MIIIGSAAIRYWIPSFREPKDYDVFSTKKVEGYDCIIVPNDVINFIPFEFPRDNYTGYGYATLDAVYTIKCSHLGWDIKWSKHKSDVLYLKAIGCKLIPDLYEALVKHWRKVNGNKEHLSLYKKKTDFFNDYVPYVYDHDYIHDLVAYPNKPVYTLCLKDGEDVAVEKEKFFSLPLEQQLRMFREEISVIAAERWLIPPKICGKYSILQAYTLALHKTVVDLTKNWATDFLIEHLDYFVKPDLTYFKHLFETIKEGKIIMGKNVKNWEDLINDIIIAYNETSPRYEVGKGSWGDFVYEIPDFDEFEMIESDSGREGHGEYCSSIFKWKGKIYKFEYSYYSHYGLSFDNATLTEVKPVQKIVTVYE